jgi:LAO/AO transport system kinase
MPHKPLHALSIDEMVDGIVKGDRHMLSRAITLVESRKQEHETTAHAVLDRCLSKTGTHRTTVRVGITGAPGVGKSTFIESFGLELLGKGLRVAVLAVDPSSTRSGGSILGDKARMERLSGKKEVFIRPTPSSGFLGGTSPKTHEAIVLCEAAGFDVVIVETVGVGQSEILVNSMVDFILLLMLPGSGDDLQGIKRGIMEIADTIAVTKADGERMNSARSSKSDFETAVHLLPEKHPGWTRKVLLTSAVSGAGIAETWQTVRDYQGFMQQHGLFEKQRREQLAVLLGSIIEEQLKKEFARYPAVQALRQEIENRVLSGTLSPYSGASALVDAFMTRR